MATSIPSKNLVKNRFEVAAAFGLGDCELHFQMIAQSHQLINYVDDSTLFRNWR